MKNWTVFEWCVFLCVATWAAAEMIGVVRGTRQPDGCGCFTNVRVESRANDGGAP